MLLIAAMLAVGILVGVRNTRSEPQPVCHESAPVAHLGTAIVCEQP